MSLEYFVRLLDLDQRPQHAALIDNEESPPDFYSPIFAHALAMVSLARLKKKKATPVSVHQKKGKHCQSQAQTLDPK